MVEKTLRLESMVVSVGNRTKNIADIGEFNICIQVFKSKGERLKCEEILDEVQLENRQTKIQTESDKLLIGMSSSLVYRFSCARNGASASYVGSITTCTEE